MRPLVSLKFKSLTNLMEFRLAVGARVFHISLDELVIDCECSDADIKLAIEKYDAVVEHAKSGKT